MSLPSPCPTTGGQWGFALLGSGATRWSVSSEDKGIMPGLPGQNHSCVMAPSGVGCAPDPYSGIQASHSEGHSRHSHSPGHGAAGKDPCTQFPPDPLCAFPADISEFTVALALRAEPSALAPQGNVLWPTEQTS